jgi:predicted alpha/beta hydrolase family esterase
MSRPQVFIFHGGDSFPSYEAYIQSLRAKVIDYDRLKYSQRWREWIAQSMPEVDVLLPTMPNSSNAQFEEWKIYFEKLIPLFGDDVQLVGHSLGAMFLAKYLQQYPLDQKVRRIVLIAGQFDETNDSESGNCGSFEVRIADQVAQSAQEVHLFHSKDDPVVPFTELAKFQADLPDATSHIFEDRGHFIDSTFPEILDLLKQK